MIVFLTILLILTASGYFLFHKKATPLSDKNNPETTKLPEEFPLNQEVEIPFAMTKIPDIPFPDRVCNIADYGGIGDGRTKNTEAFARAIADCAAQGGGKVEVPSGVWLSGAIHLKSNVNLQIDKNAEIRFSTDFDDYLPPVFSRFEGIELYNYSSLIYASNCQNIAITGQGKIDGQGQAWYGWEHTRELSIQNLQATPLNQNDQRSFAKLYLMARNNVPPAERVFGNKNDALPPPFIQFVNCKNVLIDGISIENSPSWTVQPLYSQNVIIRNISIKNKGPNTDGIDIDSSKNVIVENSKFDTGDDAIAIKSGRDEDGLRVARPSENIIIRNCNIDEAHSALAIGSEMSGGVKNVMAYNLDINYVDYGLRLKSTPGRGGIVENIWLKNINIHRAVSDAIQIDSNYGTPVPGYDKMALSIFKNITIENFYCRRTSRAAELLGLPASPLENLIFKNVIISAARGILEENVVGKNFKNVQIKTN